MKKQIFHLFTFLILITCGCTQKKTQTTFSDDTLKDIDGNVYKTVKIGNQWWMTENLKVIHYRNGDKIPCLTDDDEWDQSTRAYCYYNNDTTNVEIYGRLYNWFAVNDSRKIAPEGWHVPTDEEWQELVDYLGGDTLAGGKMKTQEQLGEAMAYGVALMRVPQTKAAFQRCPVVTDTTMEYSMV